MQGTVWASLRINTEPMVAITKGLHPKRQGNGLARLQVFLKCLSLRLRAAKSPFFYSLHVAFSF